MRGLSSHLRVIGFPIFASQHYIVFEVLKCSAYGTATGFDQPPPGGILPGMMGAMGVPAALPPGMPGVEAISVAAAVAPASTGFSNGGFSAAPPMMGMQTGGAFPPT